MSQPPTKKYHGKNHDNAERSAPYPVSRLAPSMELVDLARTISEADKAIQTHTTGKLKIIAGQINALQEEARKILHQAQRDQQLHRARCHSQRITGKTYHLYRHENGELYFSLLSPEDWHGQTPHPYEGAYRLENDMSWTALAETTPNEETQPAMQNLLAQLDIDRDENPG